MKLIPLTQGMFAMVDDDDYEELIKFKWYYANGYACRKLSRKLGHITILMHLELLGASSFAKQGDHKNGNPLDNRRNNLRPATKPQQSFNKKLRSDNSTGFKGVSIDKGRFRARIHINKKEILIGYYDTAEKAYEAYCEAAKKYHGDFARLK